jgi:hypothetical protein
MIKTDNFLTLKQAAKKFNPTVDVDDVLQMALNGELKLSVNFINPVYYARTGAFHRLSEQHEAIFYPDYSSFENLTGIYDLAMIGNEKLDVQNKLRQSSGEQEIDFDKSLLSPLGCIVVDENGQHYQLLQFLGDEDDWLSYGAVEDENGNIRFLEKDDLENYEIRERLPVKGLDFVVRESAINEFVRSLSPQTNHENLIDLTENNALFVQHGNEPKAPSSLLNLPQKRKNDWAEVINEMANQFLRKHGKLPTAAQGWDSLCNTPPVGYEITIGKDKGGEDCLIMAGKAKTLSRNAFNQRWSKRYIKQSPNHQT